MSLSRKRASSLLFVCVLLGLEGGEARCDELALEAQHPPIDDGSDAAIDKPDNDSHRRQLQAVPAHASETTLLRPSDYISYDNIGNPVCYVDHVLQKGKFSLSANYQIGDIIEEY